MPINYTLTNNAGGKFAISSGKVVVAGSLTIGTSTIEITADDGNGWTKKKSFDIPVTAPTPGGGGTQPPLSYTLLDSLNSIAGRTMTANAVMSVASPILSDTGSIKIEAGGNSQASMNTAGFSDGGGDPAAWGLMAMLVDLGDTAGQSFLNSPRVAVVQGGTTYQYAADTTITGAAPPVFTAHHDRGYRWKTFKALRLRAGGVWGNAKLSEAGAGTREWRINPLYDGSGVSGAHRGDVIRVGPVIHIPTPSKPTVVITLDDVNPLQYALCQELAARGMFATLMVPLDRVAYGGRLTVAQLLDIKAMGHTIALDSGRQDESILRYPSVTAAVNGMLADKAAIVAAGLATDNDLKLFCYSFGRHCYEPRSTVVAVTQAATSPNVNVGGSLAYGAALCAGVVVKGTGLSPDPVVVEAPDPSGAVVVLSQPLPAGSYNLRFCANELGRTLVCNGTTTIQITDTLNGAGTGAAGLFVGQLLRGNGVPANTRVTAVTGADTVTVSNAVPATCVRGSFFHDQGEFFSGKLPDALRAAGFEMGRDVTRYGGTFTGFGLDPRHAMQVPGFSMDVTTSLLLSQVIGNTQMAIDDGCDTIGYLHASDTNYSQTLMYQYLDYLQARKNAGEIEINNLHTWWTKVKGRGAFV